MPTTPRKPFHLSSSCLFLALFAASAAAQTPPAPVVATGGLDLDNQGVIFNAPLVQVPAPSNPNENGWETNGAYQKVVVPVANLIGQDPGGGLIPYNQLLPVRLSRLSIMTGSGTGAPTGVGTVIDNVGILTTSVITDALFLVNPVTQQPLAVATISNGVVTFPQTAVFPSNGSLSLPGSFTLQGANGNTTLSSPYAGSFVVSHPGYNVNATTHRAVAIGGQNGTASGDGAVLIGGGEGTGAANLASGKNSTIIGSGRSTVAGVYSSILGSLNSKILNPGSAYNVIVGGVNHQMSATAGSYNVILGGAVNEFVSGGHSSALIAGKNNKILEGSHHQAIVGGEYSQIDNNRNSVILGGTLNRIHNAITGAYPWMYPASAILGGHSNQIGENAAAAVVLGGAFNTANGVGAAVVASWQSSATGELASVIASRLSTASSPRAFAQGLGTQATGPEQVTFGRYNTAHATHAFIIGNGSSASARSSALTVDFSGNVSAQGQVSAASVSTPGTVQAGSFTTTGAVQAGSFTTTTAVVAGSVTTTGAVQAGSFTSTGAVQAGSVTTTGSVQAGSVTTTGAVQAGSVTTTGAVQAGSFTTTGAVQAGSFTTTGAVQAGSISTDALTLTPGVDTTDISMGPFTTP